MSKFIVMDIVFYGDSLNYDQGSGNYQELKKVTKWDGKQYTLVSRYALRYSILDYGKKIGVWPLASTDYFEKDGDVIQPDPEKLVNGEILNFPEFDLFGYLITTTDPQNNKEAPVKISHAVSLTPFNYDNHFCANVGLANRIKEKFGDLSPNPFTVEEHHTYYTYSVVIDVSKVGKIDIYLVNKDKNKIEELDDRNIKIKFKKSKNEINLNNWIKINNNVYKITYELTKEEKIKRIKDLIKILLNLKRDIKAREEDISPKLLVLGLYDNTPYKTYKDKIILLDEELEECYEEVIEEEKEGKKIRKVVQRINKSKKPVFEINENLNISELDEDEILDKIEKFLSSENEKTYEEKCVYYDKGIKVKNGGGDQK